MLATIGLAFALAAPPPPPATGWLPSSALQARLRVYGPNNEIEVGPARKISGFLTGAGAFEVEGEPATIQWKDAGLVFAANIMTGALGANPGPQYFIKTASFRDNVQISFDSNRIRSFVENRTGSPVPPAESAMQMALKAEQITYAGDFNVGTLSLSSPFQFSGTMTGQQVDSSSGSPVMQTLTDTLSLTGASGEIGIRTHPAADEMLFRTGFMSGPVNFRYRRQAAANGAPDALLDLTGVADRLEFDFVGASHTLTLLGHVHIEGVRGPYQGSTSGDRAVLTFGANNRLVNITIEGSPSESNLKPRPTTGGGR